MFTAPLPYRMSCIFSTLLIRQGEACWSALKGTLQLIEAAVCQEEFSIAVDPPVRVT